MAATDHDAGYQVNLIRKPSAGLLSPDTVTTDLSVFGVEVSITLRWTALSILAHISLQTLKTPES